MRNLIRPPQKSNQIENTIIEKTNCDAVHCTKEYVVGEKEGQKLKGHLTPQYIVYIVTVK